MRADLNKKKLIVLLNLSGSYKGGAQRRYTALFNYLQKIEKNDYLLLLNDSLYNECLRDNILNDFKNVLSISVKYGKEVPPRGRSNHLIARTNSLVDLKRRSRLYNFLGLVSSFLKQFRSWLSFSLSLIKIIRSYNIGVIYGVFTGGMWSWPVVKLMNIKFIYSYNDTGASTVEKNILKILSSEYYPLKFADKIDFLSKGLIVKLNSIGVKLNEKKALFTPNSFILYNNFYPVYPKKDWVVFSARLAKIKNPSLFLEAIKILQNRGFSKFSFYFLGDGQLYNDLVKHKDKLMLENVFFEGGVIDTSKYLKKSKIFISVQREDNYPSQSLLEAMACENAIIASDVGETRKLVAENEGILVPLNEEKIADAIQFLIENPVECERFGKNARKKVLEEHTIERYSKYFLSITKT